MVFENSLNAGYTQAVTTIFRQLVVKKPPFVSKCKEVCNNLRTNNAINELIKGSVLMVGLIHVIGGVTFCVDQLDLQRYKATSDFLLYQSNRNIQLVVDEYESQKKIASVR